MRYVVTGATGFIGGRVAYQLAAAGHQVVAIARNPAKASDLAAAGIEVVRADIGDKESMRAAMRGADGIFHIAGWYKVGVRTPHEAISINIDGTRNVLELMRELEIPRGVYTSTLAINSDTHGQLVDERYHYRGPHLSLYDRTKWVAHHGVAVPMMAAGLPLTIVMPGLVYGPGDPSAAGEALRRYLRGQLPIAPAGTMFCWAHVDDVARGHLLAMERGRPGETYMLAGPPHQLVEALALAEQICGKPAPRVQPPPVVVRAVSVLVGLVEIVAELPAEYSAEYLRVNAGVTYIGDNRKARAELGFDPRPLRVGLEETIRYELARM